MAEHTLIGKNYSTPDLVAKVTGKAKYAEDFRAEGMLFCKLLVSPMPHARVTRLDTTAALAVPGVKAILTADELPAPADIVTDLGAVIKANPLGERPLSNEPLYAGEPILAVAAVDELTAAEAIERIQIEFEPLEHVTDPIETLRPGGANARLTGNMWARPEAPPAAAGAPPAPPGPPEPTSWKWTPEEAAELAEGRLPMERATDEWSYGDIEAGFKNAALVLDETFVTPNTSHQCMETRSSMCYWQNGKVYVHTSTQSTAQTVMSVSRWLGVEPENVVLVSEYTGGGFGSKATGTMPLIIPALLAKKANAPVMMRVTREDEQMVGRARPALHGRLKVGFAKDGRITAVDMFTICDSGPYDPVGDGGQAGRQVSLMFQPQAMRWRGLTVMTNTPPRGAQRAPGGMQGMGLIEPILAKAAKELGVDQLDLHRVNAPEGKAPFGPANREGNRPYVTSAFVKEALDKGRESFEWDNRKSRIAAHNQNGGRTRRGLGVAMSSFVAGSVGFDSLFIIKPDGRVAFHTGIGNLGTESFSDCQRVAAEMIGVPWEKVDVVFGSTQRNLAWSCVSGGSQTVHAHTRTAHAAATDAIKKLQEIAARDLGGRPEDYEVANERVARRGGGRGLTLAQAAQRAIELGGKYDGHEVPENVNGMTKRSAAALAGQGLMAVARDTYPRDGATHSYTMGFAEVEVDVDTGKYHILDYMAVADVGTVIHPRVLQGQTLGGSLQGIGQATSQKWVYDQHYGTPMAKRFYQTRPPSILDAPATMRFAAVDLPDPETPVGARGVGEPPVGAGFCAVLNAIADAVGHDVFRRAPVSLDMILTSLEEGRRVTEPLTANI